MKRATKRPSINNLNKTLRRLVAAGVDTYQESVKQRGFWAQLMNRRPARRGRRKLA